MSTIKKRKDDHVRICLKEDVVYRHNFFDDIEFMHFALTDLNYDDLDTETIFINHHLKYPFMITGMTGGYPEAKKINRRLAALCEKYGIAFGLGSQRAMLENPKMKDTYYVRDVAESIPIIGNIGAVQISQYGSSKINDMLKDVDANYLAIHLNTLQELVQPEGDRNFKGLRASVESLCREIEFPVILKETGAGISRRVVNLFTGPKPYIKGIDVAGRSGTSWSRVEEFRGGDAGPFSEWGNPTPVCIVEVSRTGTFTIASGGIRDGLDVARAIALGADVGGGALVFIKAYYENTLEKTIEEKFITYLKRAMMLTNSQNLHELFCCNIVITGKTAEWMRTRGIDINSYANKR
ncbi:MAG: type 2 isopentenyl-diphosphate Delta-isomerase [Candidatus Micrarchaeia archaeon]